MALPELPRYPEMVSLVPHTGIQFLDFGFALKLPDGRTNPKLPTDWGFFDPRPDARQNALAQPVLMRRGGTELTPGQDDYLISMKQLVEFATRTWLPLPLLREERGGRWYQGPI